MQGRHKEYQGPKGLEYHSILYAFIFNTGPVLDSQNVWPILTLCRTNF